jgi:hypothetical protein
MTKSLKQYPADGRSHETDVPAATVLAMYAAWHKLQQFGPATGFSPRSEVPANGLYNALLEVDDAFQFLRVGLTLEITTHYFLSTEKILVATNQLFASLDRTLVHHMGEAGAQAYAWGQAMDNDNTRAGASQRYVWVYKLRPVLGKTAPNNLFAKVIFQAELQRFQGDGEGYLTFAYSCVTHPDIGKGIYFLGTHAAKELPQPYRFLSSAKGSDIRKLINNKNLRNHPGATFESRPVADSPKNGLPLVGIEPMHPIKSGLLALRHRAVDVVKAKLNSVKKTS